MAVISRTSVRPVTASEPIGWISPGFSEPQQHRLHAQAHLAELVEEQRAVVGLADQARLVPIRAGEAAAHVAKQLGLEQRLGNAAAVDGDEGAADARALRVNQLRDHFLAHTGLAEDQHFGFGAGGCLDVTTQLDERRAFTKQ